MGQRRFLKLKWVIWLFSWRCEYYLWPMFKDLNIPHGLSNTEEIGLSGFVYRKTTANTGQSTDQWIKYKVATFWNVIVRPIENWARNQNHDDFGSIVHFMVFLAIQNRIQHIYSKHWFDFMCGTSKSHGLDWKGMRNPWKWRHTQCLDPPEWRWWWDFSCRICRGGQKRRIEPNVIAIFRGIS